MRYQNICSALFTFVTKHAWDRQTNKQTEAWMDRQTDEQNYNSKDCASIVALHVNIMYTLMCSVNNDQCLSYLTDMVQYGTMTQITSKAAISNCGSI